MLAYQRGFTIWYRNRQGENDCDLVFADSADEALERWRGYPSTGPAYGQHNPSVDPKPSRVRIEGDVPAETFEAMRRTLAAAGFELKPKGKFRNA